MRSLPRPLAPLVLLLLAACASNPQAGDTPRRVPDLITTAEIERTHSTDAFALVRVLRPNWLRARGGARTIALYVNDRTPRGSNTSTASMAEAQIPVYHNNVRLGGSAALRQITPTSVLSIRFMDASTATQRWGTGHPHGAIVVMSR